MLHFVNIFTVNVRVNHKTNEIPYQCSSTALLMLDNAIYVDIEFMWLIDVHCIGWGERHPPIKSQPSSVPHHPLFILHTF